MRITFACLLVGIVTSVGCDISSNTAKKPVTATGATGVAEPAPEQPKAAATTEPAKEPEVVREKATEAVKPKGQDYAEGIITTPIKAYFSAGQRITFEIQLPKAMQLYKATNGSPPKSQQEFDQFLADNLIELPELPPGSRYVYDPQVAQKTPEGEIDYLLVEHRK